MEVSIGRCRPDDIDDVVRFLDEHWKRGHVLARCRPLLDWQYRDADGAGYSFVVARRTDDLAVLGILGYISTRRFDPALVNDNVVWLTTWKVRDDAGIAGLGMQLLQHLAGLEPHVAIGALGLTPSTLPIYRALRYTVGELTHYVLRRGPSADGGLMGRHLHLVANVGGWTADAVVPRKTVEYFRRRYLGHPVYEYDVRVLMDERSPAGLVAARLAHYDDIRALRIVDVAGGPGVLARAGAVLQSLIAEHDAHYADVYNTGIGEEAFADAGFEKVDPDGAEIVADHFEPFERRNVRLWYAMKGARPVLFKGDADQDRPSVVERIRA